MVRQYLARLRGLEGLTLRNPLEINAATSKVGTTNSLAGVHDPERKSWVVVAPATPVSACSAGVATRVPVGCNESGALPGRRWWGYAHPTSAPLRTSPARLARSVPEPGPAATVPKSPADNRPGTQ